MAKITAAITGIQGYVPDYVLTNAELEKIVDTNDEWILSRTGIKERRILKGDGLGTSHMGIEAVKRLLEKTGTHPDEIELVICATVTPDMPFPDTANLIAYGCGISNAFCFDINAACSGFIYALTTGARYVESGMYKKVLVVGADKMSSIVNYEDRTTCIIFGDGAGVVLLEPTTDGVGIMDSLHKSDGSGQEFLYRKAGGSRYPFGSKDVSATDYFVYQNGKPVFKAAVTGMADVVQKVMERNQLTADTVSWLIPHQANKRIIEVVAEHANFPMEKVTMNIEKYGNTTAATIPLCIWEWENQFKKGDNIILTAFGGGFTWGAIYLKWAY